MTVNKKQQLSIPFLFQVLVFYYYTLSNDKKNAFP